MPIIMTGALSMRSLLGVNCAWREWRYVIEQSNTAAIVPELGSEPRPPQTLQSTRRSRRSVWGRPGASGTKVDRQGKPPNHKPFGLMSA